MPEVPKYGDLKVQQAGIANTRSNVNASIEAFGGGQANKLPGAISELSGEGLKLAKQEKDNSDHLANNRFANELGEFELDGHRDGGVFTFKGEDAFTKAPDELEKRYKEKLDDMMSRAANDDQKEYVREKANDVLGEK